MFKKQVTVNIEDLDKKIGKLSKELEAVEDDDEKYETITNKLNDLTDLRCKLSESKINGSIKPVVVSGLLSIASLVIVLKYEETEVITSKAFSMIPNMLKGSK